MSRTAEAVINLAALRHNLARIQSIASKQQVFAIVKANGYGHGLARVARALTQADGFGVASLDEALQLREAGVTQPILLLEGCFSEDEWATAAEVGCQIVVHQESQLKQLEAVALSQAIKVWLKVDTGMHRLGISPEQAHSYKQRLKSLSYVSEVVVMTHLANADDTSDTATQVQLQQFAIALTRGEDRVSIANSAGILGWPTTHGDVVRPGISLYGGSPLRGMTADSLGLRPVMTFRSRLFAIKQLKQGEPIGYGGSYRCPEDMTVGVVSCGYGDGYPRHAPSGTPVLVNGKRVPLIGRVSMDMITVDLRSQPEAAIGDEVILWGEGLPADEVAEKSATIAYELFCKVTSRTQMIESED